MFFLNARRRIFGNTALLIALFIAPWMAPAAHAAELRPGQDFQMIEPPFATDDKTRIEVLEFFWYGCNHCSDFEPTLGEWVKKLPGDVSFRRVPALFPNMKWAAGARLFYTLEAMGLTEKLHTKAFRAIHEERLRLDDDFVLLDWVAKQGVDRAKFKETMLSFAVNARVQQARSTTAAAIISGVPTVIVQGRYMANTTGNYGDLLRIIDQLIARARSESAGTQGATGKK
jgi:thiol:disulfide interchange protein DsbA